MKIIFKFIIPVGAIFFCLLSAFPAAAQNLSNAFGTPLNTAANSATYQTGAGAATPEEIISGGINIALSILGAIFMIISVYAGIKWMTAGGNEEDVTKAKNTIKHSLIGLAITLAAYAISFFVLSALMAGNKLGPGAV